jgi:hypothetical protein
MKITITPDYIRYTEFTPVMRIVLAELAEQRNLYVMRFRLAQVRYDAIMEGKGPIVEADVLYKQMQNHLEVIGEIDQAIREIYFLHGRLN